MSDIYIGLIIGALAVNAIWMVVSWMRGLKTDGKLTIDLSGETNPVSLDLSKFKKMDTAKKVRLDFEVIMPEEEME